MVQGSQARGTCNERWRPFLPQYHCSSNSWASTTASHLHYLCYQSTDQQGVFLSSNIFVHQTHGPSQKLLIPICAHQTHHFQSSGRVCLTPASLLRMGEVGCLFHLADQISYHPLPQIIKRREEKQKCPAHTQHCSAPGLFCSC